MKKPGIALGLVALAVLIAALWQGPALIPQASLRGWVAPQLQRALAQGAAIDGAISFALLPGPRLIARDVRISRGGQEIGRIAEVQAGLQILPLLIGRLQPASLTVIRPELHWTPAASAPAAAAASESATATTAPPPPPARSPAPWPAEIRIEQGQAEIAGATLSPIDVTLRQQNDILHLDGKAGWQGRIFDIAAALGAAATDVTLRQADAGELQFHGQGGPTALQGKLSGKSADLSRLAADLPPLAAQFSSEVNVTDDGIDATSVKLTLGESDLAGQAHVSLVGRTRFDLTLQGGLLDLDRVLAVKPPAAAANSRPAAPPPPSPAESPQWRGPDGEVHLAIDQIRWRGRVVQDLKLDVTSDHGEVTLDHVSLSLPGNSQLGLFGHWSGAAGFTGAFEGSSDDLRQMLAWAGWEPQDIAADRLHVARLAGDIKASASEISLERVRLKIDSSQIDLSARYSAAPRPALGLTFALDSLNADAYLPHPTNAPPQSAPATGTTLDTAPATASPPPFDAEITGQIGRLLWHGVGMSDIAVRAAWNGQRLTLKPLTIGDLGGARLVWNGDVVAGPQGLAFDGMQGSVKAADLSRLLRGFGADLPLALPAELTVAAQGPVTAPALHVSASQIDFGKTRLMQPAADITLSQDQILLDAFSGRLFGGQLGGDGALVRQNGAVKLHLTLTQGNMREALLEVADVGLADGVMEGEVTLTSQGHYPSELKAHLDGSARLLIRDGQIKGFDLKAADRAVAGQFGFGSLIMLVQAGLTGGATHFSQLSGSARIAQGVITSNDLKLLADGGGATGEARVDLPADSVEAHADFRFASASDAPPLVMRLTGSLQSPRRFLDIKPLQQWLADHGVKGAKPKDVLKGLLQGIVR